MVGAVVSVMSEALERCTGGIQDKDADPFCLEIELSCEFAVVLYRQEIDEEAVMDMLFE